MSKAEDFKPGDQAKVYGFIDSGRDPLLCFGEVLTVGDSMRIGLVTLQNDRGERFFAHPRQLEKYDPPKPREFQLLFCSRSGDIIHQPDFEIEKCPDCIDIVRVREILKCADASCAKCKEGEPCR